MPVKLCWWDSKNFGDALNPHLFKALGSSVKYAQSNEAEFLAVGSYMERLLIGALFDQRQSEQPISIWGTGFQFEPGHHLWFNNIKCPEEFIRPVNIFALRGKLSKERAEKISEQNFDGIALGDPGLLTSMIVDTKALKKKYRLGIFCHFTDNGNGIFNKIKANIKNSIRIDVEAPVTEIVKSMASCEAVISSAMHPLIIADSLRIPNQWINISDNAISKYKFDDYYSVFNLKPQCFDLNLKVFDEEDLEQLHTNYLITSEQVLEIQKGLIKACPLPGKLHQLSFPEKFTLRLREAVVRDKVISRFAENIERKWHHGRSAVQKLVKR